MEMNGCNSSDKVSLVNELTKGLELAKQLKDRLGPQFPPETREMLLEEILSSYDKALFLLNWSGKIEQPLLAVGVPSATMPSSPISFTESPRSDDLNAGTSRDFSKKRKVSPTWTKQVKVNLENGVDAPPDDGYSWRKYGQKDILGAKHPRSYYRCTYRSAQDCWATKQVQRSDEDPSAFDVTYKGKHTCRLGVRSKSAPASPEKLEANIHHLQIKEYEQEANNVLNFHTGLIVDIPNSDNQDMVFPFSSTGMECMNSSGNHNVSPSTLDHHSFYSSFSPQFISQDPSESNYFPMVAMDTFGGFQHRRHSESDMTEIVSVTTSGTNSPIVELDFSLNPLHFSPSFPFDNNHFFPDHGSL